MSPCACLPRCARARLRSRTVAGSLPGGDPGLTAGDWEDGVPLWWVPDVMSALNTRL